jgi:hyperosmotically inducible protein
MKHTCHSINNVARLFATVVLLAAPSWATPQANPQPNADNTKTNQADRNPSAPTADQATNGKSDRQIMADIRKSITGDKSLSTYGHNVKVISQHGKVTLKGPVHTEEEKTAIESKAAQIAGDSNVNSEITVKGDSR